LDKFERIMATISPIMGIGLGLWFSNYLDKNNALLIGIFIVFIAAVLLSIFGFLRNKALAEQNK
jgi:hypothetical protein